MLLQNSYVFLPNPYNKNSGLWEDPNGVLHVETGHSIHSHILNAFPGINWARKDGNYFHTEYSTRFETSHNNVNICITARNVRDNCYVTIFAEGHKKVHLVAALEYFHSSLFSTTIGEDYIPIVSFDAVSEYYCNQLYPQLNLIERKIRRLLFNIYTLNFGKDYFQKTIPDELLVKAKEVIQAKGGSQRREIQYIKEFFYSLELTDVQHLLFDTHWTQYDNERMNSFLSASSDLSTLSDAELRKAINGFAPRSDWTRFFDQKFDAIDIQADIEIVRKTRNKVAHCKFLNKDD